MVEPARVENVIICVVAVEIVAVETCRRVVEIQFEKIVEMVAVEFTVR